MPRHPSHRVTVELSLDQRDPESGSSYDPFVELVKTTTTITLPVPKPETLKDLITSLVGGLIDVSGSKGVPFDGTPDPRQGRIDAALAKLDQADPLDLTEAGYGAVLSS